MNDNSPDNKKGWVRKELPGIPAGIGALWTRREGGAWHYGVAVDASHCNAQGFVHGGVLMTFMDHALSLMVWETAQRAPCSTVQLDSHFLAAVKAPAFLQLQGEVTRQGRRLVFARGVLLLEDRAVMEATGVWSVISV